MTSESDGSKTREDRVHSWLDDPPKKRGRGRPFKHYGNAAERHRAAQAVYARKRRWALALDANKTASSKSARADYMRRYRAGHPAYVEAANRRRKTRRLGASTLVPPQLDGLNLNPSALRALTARSVDYGSQPMRKLMEDQPELATQVLARVALGLVLMAKGGIFGRMMAGSLVRTLPGVGGRVRRRGREPISDREWRDRISPIVPLDAKRGRAEQCNACGGFSFAEDVGRGEHFCLGCGAVVPDGPKMVPGRRPSAQEH